METLPINWLAVAVASIAYFALGGLWFSPLMFGKSWDRAIGFDRPVQWRPGIIFYAGPLIGCWVASFATAMLLHFAQPQSFMHAIGLGLVVGLGYGGTVTGVNAISPTLPRPGLFAAITGSYHAIGLIGVTLILYVWP